MANSTIADASDQLLGRVAVAAKLISVDQLAQATREQSRSGSDKRLGDVLVELGLITPEKLRRALELQKGVLERAQKKEAQAAEPPPSPPKSTRSPCPGSRAIAWLYRPGGPAMLASTQREVLQLQIRVSPSPT